MKKQARQPLTSPSDSLPNSSLLRESAFKVRFDLQIDSRSQGLKTSQSAQVRFTLEFSTLLCCMVLSPQHFPGRFTKQPPFWDPRKTALRCLFFIFSQTSYRRTMQRRTTQTFVVNIDQLVLEFSCSRQRMPQNAILVSTLLK